MSANKTDNKFAKLEATESLHIIFYFKEGIREKIGGCLHYALEVYFFLTTIFLLPEYSPLAESPNISPIIIPLFRSPGLT